MNWKETYTKIFLKELDKSTNETNVKQYMPIWWQNTRNKGAGGLRLTDEGMNIVNEIGLATYDIPYPKEMPLTTQVIIFLDQFIDCPYYLTNRSITVLNEKKAVELTLFSGDLRKYGLTKAMTRQKKDSENG
jgi:NAD-dependent DNA ligase